MIKYMNDKLNIISYIQINLITPFIVFLDNIFDSFYNISGVNSKNFIIEKVTGIIIFSITILLGIDSDSENENLYKKKYIIMIYTIIALITLIGRFAYNINELIFMIIIILFITSVSALNIGYRFEIMEKELKHINLFIYSFWNWFFKAKTYISILLLLVLYNFNKYGIRIKFTNLNYSKELLNLITIVIFFFIHIIIDVKDTFGFKGFETMLDQLEETRKIISKTELIPLSDFLKLDSKPYDYEILDLLGFLIYVEDRDFLDRKKTSYSIRQVLNRKIKHEKKIKSSFHLFNKNNILNKNNINKIGNTIKKVFDNLFRGYSTIEQQVIRTSIMQEYTYHYTFRRKIFIERIYIKAFMRTYKKRKIKNRGLRTELSNYFRGREGRDLEIEKKKKRKYINNEIKLEFLIFYYIKICKKPKNMQELFEAIEEESSQSINSLNNKLNKYEESYFKPYIKNKLLKTYSKIKGGNLKMIKTKYSYDNMSKKIYIKKQNNKKEELENLASEPKKHKNKIAYIYPYDFETQNNIYTYDLVKNKKELVYAWNLDKSAKDMEWYDENTIYAILGQTYGTVAIGGDLYEINIKSKNINLIKKFAMNIQVTTIKLLNQNELRAKGIEYIDDNMNESIDYEEIIEIKKQT